MPGEFGVWSTTAPAEVPLPRLEGALDVEVAIVGAGYTGLSTALHLAEMGTPAVVIEAGTPGSGASGRNTGWLEPNWWMNTPAKIEAKFGSERGRELTRWVASGPQLLSRWIETYGMRIDDSRRGLIMATDQPKKAQALEAEALQWQNVGVSNDYLDASAIRKHIASDRYCGALWLRGGMEINPLALSRELARACSLRATRIFANSPVTSIQRDGCHWRLTCTSGVRHEVRARRLVVATDAYAGALWPSISNAFSMWRCCVVASEPYAPLTELLPSRTPFGDLNLANVFTLREACGGRLVTSTYAPVRAGLAPPRVAEPFMRKFRKVFPGRPGPRWEFAQCGEVALTNDSLPRLCNIGPDAWTAFGYSGTGINLALLMGEQLARLASGDDERMLFPVTRLQPAPMRHLLSWSLRYLQAPISRSILSRIA